MSKRILWISHREEVKEAEYHRPPTKGEITLDYDIIGRFIFPQGINLWARGMDNYIKYRRYILEDRLFFYLFL